VPLNRDVRQALAAWLEVRPEEDTPALFLSQKGGAHSPRAISSRVTQLAEQAGLEDVSPHTLRHSFAKNLVDAGVTLEKVATLLGHESLETTRVYVTPSQADLQAATEKVAWQD
jgi:integrase/recombinase XerC